MTPARKLGLVEVVDRYLKGGGRVFVFGGDSAWVPGPGRKNEWPQICELQQRFVIADKPTACDMYEVFDQRPVPSLGFWPLGHRQAITDGRMEPWPEDYGWPRARTQGE